MNAKRLQCTGRLQICANISKKEHKTWRSGSRGELEDEEQQLIEKFKLQFSDLAKQDREEVKEKVIK